MSSSRSSRENGGSPSSAAVVMTGEIWGAWRGGRRRRWRARLAALKGRRRRVEGSRGGGGGAGGGVAPTAGLTKPGRCSRPGGDSGVEGGARLGGDGRGRGGGGARSLVWLRGFGAQLIRFLLGRVRQTK